ncbi:MAG TPA: hypothetical protein VM146_16815 [Steroidobacteraceae bacterium]|nr:hypothetical protein [Steroidobacteraceae bacterium]
MLRKMMPALVFALGAPAYADSVACHVIYGGENFTVSAQPTGDPYAVRGEKIGRYFEVKVAYVTEPAQLAALSVYVYATSSGESVLIHQAKYPAAVGNPPGPWGFTGFNYVYEPSKSSELQYWCEKRPGA